MPPVFTGLNKMSFKVTNSVFDLQFNPYVENSKTIYCC